MLNDVATLAQIAGYFSHDVHRLISIDPQMAI